MIFLIANLTAAEKTVSHFTACPDRNKNKKIVLICGDEEYRSEETLPQLAKILAQKHGFDTTVLYPIDPQNGLIVPTCLTNISGLENLNDADLLILAIRFRNLPDRQMKAFDDYLRTGRPVLALRTSTHGFNPDKTSAYAHYGWRYKDNLPNGWTGGFGRKILGETWINHHGKHGVEGTKMIPVPGMENHPVLRGVKNLVVPTDVYQVRLPLPGDSKPIALGAVLSGLKNTDPPVSSDKNNPMMPVVWTKSYQIDNHCAVGRSLTSTMGSGQDLLNEGFRRLLINASYWLLGLENQINENSDVGLIGPYDPLHFGFGKFKPNLRPE